MPRATLLNNPGQSHSIRTTPSGFPESDTLRAHRRPAARAASSCEA
jgi:hypothetical protein